MKRSDFISSPSPPCLPALPLSFSPARTRCIEGKEILSMGDGLLGPVLNSITRDGQTE